MFEALAEAKTGEYERSMVSLHTAELNCAGNVDSQLRKVRTLELLKKYEEAFDTAKACLARGVTPFQFEHLPDIDNLRNQFETQGLLRSASIPSKDPFLNNPRISCEYPNRAARRYGSSSGRASAR